MYTAYRVDKTPEVWDALVRGFGARDVPALGPGLDPEGGTHIIGGLDRGSFKLLRQARDQQRPYLFVDSGYMAAFLGGKRARYRIVPDAYNQNWIGPRHPARFESLGIKIQPWRKAGREILVCSSSDTHAEFFGLQSWAHDMVESLHRFTDRPIVLRRKGDPVPFAQALRTAWAVVAWSSAASVEAALAGVPVFVGPESAALPVNAGDVSDIERPAYHDRDQWAHSLAWAQFTVEEIASGFVRHHVRYTHAHRQHAAASEARAG